MKKHRLKEMIVTPRCGVPLSNGEAAGVGWALRAQNVREREQSLQVTGIPVRVGGLNTGERLLLITDGHYVSCNGSDVYIDKALVATVQGSIVGAHAIGGLVVIVATDGFTYLTMTDGGSWTVLDITDALPQMTIGTVDETLSADLNAYNFAEPYTQWSAPLADADVTALARQLRAAWNALSADVAAEGRHAAPMLVRWALRMHDDTYVWMSDPVRVGDETLANADRIAAQVVYDSNGFTGIEATQLSMVHYGLSIAASGGIAEQWLPLVKSVDVLVTDEAQLLTSSSALDYRCLTRASAEREYVLEMGLSRRSEAAIAAQLQASSWHLVAAAPVASDMSSAEFITPVEPLSLIPAQCAAIGSSMQVGNVAGCASAGGRLYCCTAGGDVVVSAPGNALVEAHRSSVLGSEPLAMAVVTRPLYSGGFGRYPVYVFTDDGIYAIPQTTMGTLGEARLVDRTVIAADVPPVEAGRDIWFISRHGQLCCLSGSQVTVCMTDVDCTGLAWCNAYRELWLLPSQGYPVVRMESGAVSTRTVNAVQLYSDTRHAVALTASGAVLDLEQETAGTMSVEWYTHPIALEHLLAMTLQRVVWHVSGEGLELALNVVGQRGIMADDVSVSTMQLTGTNSVPLATAPMGVRARTLRLHVAGVALSGTLLLPTVLYLRNYGCR